MRIQLLVGIFLFLIPCVYAQKADSLSSRLDQVGSFPGRFFSRMQAKSQDLNNSLDRQTDKYLQRLQRKENKFRRRLAKKDSAAAARFAKTPASYQDYTDRMKKTDSSSKGSLSGEYIPYSDSLNGSLSFLQQNKSKLNLSSAAQNQLGQSASDFNVLQGKLQATDQAKAFITQRKEQMKALVLRYPDDAGLKKYLDDYNKQAFYYSEQIREYKQMLNDPDKLLKEALVVLNKIPAFQSFMKGNSQLVGLFCISSDYGSAAGVEGLQTRDQVQSLLQEQIGSGGSSGAGAFQSNLQSANQGLDQFKDKLSSLGGGSGDMDMPSFKPNPQKTHSFLKRIEIGTNMQTTKANYFFPSTTDIGLSVGYKLNGKSTIGIGGSYKIGWKTNISHIKLSNEGASVRSFLDYQLKKQFYLSGGYEVNYQQAFSSFSQLRSVTDWTQSGLIGISKVVSLGGKLVEKTKVRLLWDFLSYQQLPATQHFLFRIEYNVK